MDKGLLVVKNGESVKLSELPNLPFESFCDSLKSLASEEGKIVHYFAYEAAEQLKLMAVVRTDKLYILNTDAPEKYLALTCSSDKFHMFEREIAEQYAIQPIDHPWFKSVRYHENYRGKTDLFGNNYEEDIPGNYNYYSVTGDDIHEVAVGPVHAGVIEPGHFRFNCIGEVVLNLEIQLGFQHRGVEKMLVSTPQKRHLNLIEGIAGDTSMGHSLCYAQAMEALCGLKTNAHSQLVRCMALELERLSNHIGDLGALSGDVAFLPPASYFGRIRGNFLNMLLLLAGNRFGKGLIQPGGLRYLLSEKNFDNIQQMCRDLRTEIEHILDLLFSASSVLSRFEKTGTVSHQSAEQLGLVGVAGRASGVAYDVRNTYPTEYYQKIIVTPKVETTGDVMARAMVRNREILNSLDIIDAMRYEESPKEKTFDPLSPNPASVVVTLNEGWRGELSHCLITDEKGEILRYKVKDPSFHNWNGLALSLKNEQISDFPLCNKSFNLSYCGFDL
jgi:Ni,Fe-hydrogenase III large subunit